MKSALVHYHLRPGGVTQVMLNQALALRQAGHDVLIISGEPYADTALWQGIPLAVVPELNYDRYRQEQKPVSETKTASLNLAHSIEKALQDHWTGGEFNDKYNDELIIHVHNPLIRKNTLLLGALKELAYTHPLLLQNHDLAEDFRPDVYTGEEYPENCHYGVINSRDYRFLLQAGLKPEGLHLLPNEVRTLNITHNIDKTRCLYPVRGIRRKNIGEALFISLFISQNLSMAITLPPTTEQDAHVYNSWKKLALEFNLNVEFEAGLSTPFAEVMGSAKTVITTSVKEGFGFSFLEPWTAGIPVCGRRIDYVCRDFEEAGVRFDRLYHSINIPAEYTEPSKLLDKNIQALSGVYAAFGLDLPQNVIEKLTLKFSGSESFDFGAMDEQTQTGILALAAKDKTIQNRIKAANPFIESLAEAKIDPDTINANRKAVLDAYSRENTLSTIVNAYQKCLAPITQSISRQQLLELYLDPENVYLTGIGTVGSG